MSALALPEFIVKKSVIGDFNVMEVEERVLNLPWVKDKVPMAQHYRRGRSNREGMGALPPPHKQAWLAEAEKIPER